MVPCFQRFSERQFTGAMDCLPFTKENQSILYAALAQLPNEDYCEYWYFTDLNLKEPYKTMLHSFLVNLSMYAQAIPVSERFLTCTEILYRSILEGPGFAKWLDGFKDYVTARTMKKLFIDHSVMAYASYSSAIDRVPKESFSIGHIYRSNSLFAWDPPKLDPRMYVMREVIYDSDIADEFRAVLRKMLESRRAPVPVALSDVYKDTSSSCQEGKVWMQPVVPPAKQRDITKIVHVPRELKERRFACLETYRSIIQVMRIDMTVRKIVRKFDGFIEHLSSEVLLEKLQRALHKHDVFPCDWTRQDKKSQDSAQFFLRTSYCRDFVKEGLTKPRYLLKIMLEEINIQYGFDLPESFYDNWIFSDNGEETITLRGHGLGMANELTTLMQMVICEMVTRRVKYSPHWRGFQNDDSCLIFETWQQAHYFAQVDREITMKLGLIFKGKASFISLGSAVLCETYAASWHPHIQVKKPYQFQAFGNIFKSVNVAHARENFAQYASYGNSSLIEQCQRFWGPVLHSDEFSLPYLLGGWNRPIRAGVDASFVDVDTRTPANPRILRFINAYSRPLPRAFFWDKRVAKSKLTHYYGEDFLKLAKLPVELNHSMMFRPSIERSELIRIWTQYLKSIRRRYERMVDLDLTLSLLYFRAVELLPEIDFLPPVDLRRVVQNVVRVRKMHRSQIRSPYGTKIDLALLNAFFKRGRNVLLPLRTRTITDRIGFDPAKNVPWFSRINARNAVFDVGELEEQAEIWWPPDCSREAYLHVWQTALVYSQYGFGFPMPTHPISNSKKELLLSRDIFYGHQLSVSEELTFGAMSETEQHRMWCLGPFKPQNLDWHTYRSMVGEVHNQIDLDLLIYYNDLESLMIETLRSRTQRKENAAQMHKMKRHKSLSNLYPSSVELDYTDVDNDPTVERLQELVDCGSSTQSSSFDGDVLAGTPLTPIDDPLGLLEGDIDF